MRLIENIECVYSCKGENKERKGEIHKCTVISNKGSISFAINDIGEQLLINEDILMKALTDNKSIDTEGVYLYFSKESIKPTNCIVHINVMPLMTKLYVKNNDNSIGFGNLQLRKILELKGDNVGTK